MTQRHAALAERTLLAHGMVVRCGDCGVDTLFVPVEAFDDDVALTPAVGEFCCTACGAAVLIDPLLSTVPAGSEQAHRAS